jgi:hypothetical protein
MATHIQDEDIYLRAQEHAIKDINPHLAHQIGVYRMVRGRFNSHHIRCIRKIVRLGGFTGIATVGQARDDMDSDIPAPACHNVRCEDDLVDSRELRELEEDQEDQEEEEHLGNVLVDILTVSMDCHHI